MRKINLVRFFEKRQCVSVNGAEQNVDNGADSAGRCPALLMSPFQGLGINLKSRNSSALDFAVLKGQLIWVLNDS
jgi:hypothetical protein